MNLKEILRGWLSKSDITGLVSQMRDDSAKEDLYRLTLDEDNRVALQALWVMRHFDDNNNKWIVSKRDELIDRVMAEDSTAKRRLMLGLLSRQPFDEENVRTDFLDFCLANITACAQPYAVRAQCIKLAYEQCKFFPELLDELKATLDMLAQGPLSPGLASARLQIMKKIKRKNKK